MITADGRHYGSTKKTRRTNRKATRRAAKMQLAKGLEPAPITSRDKAYLD